MDLNQDELIGTLQNLIKTENKQQFFKTQVKGSNFYNKIIIQHALNTRQHQLTKQELQILAQIIQQEGQYSQNKYIHSFELMSLLYELSNPKTQGERISQIIQQLREYYFQITHNDLQPSDLVGAAVSGGADGASLIPSQITEDVLNYQAILKTATNNINQLRLIQNHSILVELDIDALLKNPTIQVLEYFMQYADVQGLGDKPIDIIQEIIQLRSTDQYKHSVPADYYLKLTISQMQKLAQQIKEVNDDQNFVNNLFQQQFNQNLKNFYNQKNADLSQQELTEKRAAFTAALEWVDQTLSQKHYSLSEQLFLEILHVEIQLNIYDKDRFLKFLELAPRGYGGITYNEAKRKYQEAKKQVYDNFWSVTYGYLNNYWISDQQIVKTYLTQFFKTATSIKPYDDFLYTDHLNDLFYSTKLLNGEQVTQLSPIRITELTEQKEITFTKINKNYFSPKESVKIQLEIQNIPSYVISIYEVNSETYFREKLAPFDNSLSLEGIIPKEKIVVEKDSNFSAVVKQKVSYDLQSLSETRRGIFIVDVMGNGISSRAVIRKGGLTVLEEYTLAGHRLTIISEDKEICTNKQLALGAQKEGGASLLVDDPSAEGTGLWIKGRFHKADDNGVVLVPFSVDRAESVPIVITHNGFADIGRLNIKTEEYQFQSAFLVNEESFLRGNKGQFIIQARLYINGVPTTMDAVSEQEVKVTTMNAENIPLSFNFTPQFNHKQEAQFQIPIKDLIRSININVSGKVKNTFSGKPVSIAQSFNQTFNLHLDDQFINLYLKNTSDQGYKLYVLGQTGEPKANKTVDLWFRSGYFNQEQNYSLRTDDQGCVTLGRLNHVASFRAEIRNVGDSTSVLKTWSLNDKQVHLQYPTEITIIGNDSFTLPFKGGDKIDLTNICFTEVLETNSSNNVNFVNSSIKIENEGRVIKVGPLTQGLYKLAIKKPILNVILVKVIKGQYWDINPAFILHERENQISEIAGIGSNDLAVLGVQLEEAKEPKNKNLQIQVHLPENAKLPEVRDSIRLHVIATQFLPYSQTRDVLEIRKTLKAPMYSSATFGLQKSIYLNNQQLGDEICYVLDRKNQQKFIGNTLEKPQILLKRTEVRDTNFEKENLEQDKEFRDGERMRMDQMGGGGMAYGSMRAAGGQSSSQGTETLNNFLEYPSLVISNIRVNEKGVAIIPNFPANNYSTVEVILTNFSSTVGGFFALPSTKVPTKDQRMQSVLKKGEFYTTGRNAVKVLRTEKREIPADAESFIIDSVEQIFSAQKELILSANGSDHENGGYNFWKFLSQWHKLSVDEQMAKYNEFACHELNLFIYFKDQQFFHGVVLPFLRNKIEKTFIDHFLLGHDKVTNSFAESSKFTTLNAMEKNLLLLSLVRNKENLRAQALADQIVKTVKTIHVDTQTSNQLFDTVILAKQQTIAAQPKPEIQPIHMSMAPSDGAIQSDFLEMCGEPAYQSECYEDLEDCGDYMESANIQLSIKSCDMREQVQVEKKQFVNRGMARLADDFSGGLAEAKKKFKPGFQNIDKTKEYVERTYYGQSQTNFQLLIKDNLFWSDLADHIAQTGGAQNFLSQNFIHATGSHAEMMCALAFLDVNFENSNYQMTNLPKRLLEITATDQNNLLIFLKEVKQGESHLNSGITIAQRFFDPKDQYYEAEDDPGVKIAQQVDEFLLDRVYGCQVVISNGSPSNLELQILTEIPDGSMPIRSIDFSKTYIRYLNSFNTISIDYYFYFPLSGKFPVYPANVSRGGQVMGIAADSEVFNVVLKKQNQKLVTFRDILMNGKEEDILNFIREQNILNREIFNWNDILWKLKDKAFYEKFLQILKDRGIYESRVWRYAFLHDDVVSVAEFLNKENNHLQRHLPGSYFSTPLIRYDPLRLFEYHPILSNRAHNFMSQSKNKILNIQFKETYLHYLQYLFTLPSLLPQHRLVWCYYLLLQERIEESINIFDQIKDPKLNEDEQFKLQFDYMRAYLDIYRGESNNFKIAREVSAQYLTYPVLSWRNLFKQVANQLDELDGKYVEESDKVTDVEINKNAKSADAEESLSFELDKTELIIYYQNLNRIRINYYELDLEVLFSRSPFIKQEANSFSYVNPNFTTLLTTNRISSQQKIKEPIPEDLQKKNLLIQISCENQLLSTTYFSSQFQVHLIENFGQVKVTDADNKPLSLVYVKCFAKDNNNNVSFYRDGYTDLRGRFDYALSSASDVDNISRFSVLVISEEYGASILEAGKPNSQGTFAIF